MRILNNSSFEKYYRNFCILLLKIVGLWPYHSKNKKRFFLGLFALSTISLIIALAGGLTNDSSTNPIIMIETVIAVCYMSVSLLLTILVHFRKRQMKKLFHCMSMNWQDLADDAEFEILQTFTRQAQVITFSFLLFSGTVCTTGAIISFMPTLINQPDVIDYTPLFPYYFDSVVIIEKLHYYQISIHNIFGIGYCCFLYFALMSFFTSSVYHACGMFTIVSEIHLIEQIYSWPFLVIELFSLILVSLVIIDVLVSGDNSVNVGQYTRACITCSLFVVYMFSLHYSGERVIQVSSNIRTAAFSSEWYLLSMKIRKMLQFIILRSSRSEQLTGGKMVVLSLESFGSIMKSSWSAAAVLATT